MDRGLKIALASGVLLGGITLALMFRHQSPRSASPTLSSERLVLREKMELPISARDTMKRPARHGNASPTMSPRVTASRPAATILTPLAPSQSPPVLARDYPHTPGNSRWGTSIGLRLPGTNHATTVRRHTVQDGDTLESLAKQHLGDAHRAMEIYDANRDVLSNPDVLPIGVEIKMPPQRRNAPPPPPPERPLVAINVVGSG